MRGIDWLRRQRKPKPQPIHISGCAIPTPRHPADDTPNIAIHDDGPQLTTEQIEQLLIDTGRELANETRYSKHTGRPIDCGCVPRYSRCYCKGPTT